jgi:type II secretory pathway pseudopilin PulG
VTGLAAGRQSITLEAMRRQAFSVLELLGVLAILVILTSLLLPRMTRVAQRQTIRPTINEAQITEAMIALRSLNTALDSHLAQYGCLACQKGNPLIFPETYDAFGQVLLSEGFIERPFQLSMSKTCVLRLRKVSTLTPGSKIDAMTGAFDLNGDGKNDVVGTVMLEAVLPDLSESEAEALKDRIDGPRPGSGGANRNLSGRVMCLAPSHDGRTEVHIYMIHK